MPKQRLLSWGGVIRADYEIVELSNRHAAIPPLPNPSPHLIPYGNGRSYGDSCLNEGGALLTTRTLDRFIAFDRESGTLTCESGVTINQILRVTVPHGWFIPVTPGTSFVTVGGAIANDVHGKNHHRFGTFGAHVKRFELLRSNGERLICSATENSDWYAATLGGLGLTGLITWVDIQLRRVESPWIDSQTIRFSGLDEFFELCAESDQRYEYTVAWIDCVEHNSQLGRGLFTRGNHAPADPSAAEYTSRDLNFPITPPVSIINPLTVKIFNSLYYHKQREKTVTNSSHYAPFFYPLDGIKHWNRAYGPRGFFQYQCVVPKHNGKFVTTALLHAIADSKQGSFLAVLKLFGDYVSPGMLSFPQPGITLAIDFPNRGDLTLRLFDKLDRIVSEAGGRIYPAKDGRMSGQFFRSSYPRWQHFSSYIDPHFSSSFWRRMMRDL